MNCQLSRDQIGPYVDGELPPDALPAMEAHLAVCVSCRAKLKSQRMLASELAAPSPAPVPDTLWPTIERKLDAEPSSGTQAARVWNVRIRRAPLALAAAVTLAAGLGILGLIWTGSEAQASIVNYGILLDALPIDAQKAFRKFLALYDAREGSPSEAKQYAPELNFDVPEVLPGGFRLEAVYLLRFGAHPGVAAAYGRDGELLGTVFHRPIQREDFGTHRDYPCVIGKHRGRKVEVGEWKLVHLTDPTTCHCVLSRLNEATELPAVMAAITPR